MAMVEGQYTSTVYSLIKESRLSEAIDCLEPILEALPANRATLSLLGHCYFHQGHFESACHVYETLVRHHGEFPEYRLHHAQALFRMGELVEANRVLEAVSGLAEQVNHLKLAIAYALDQVQECKRQLRASDSETEAGAQVEGCVLYKEGLYKRARHKFEQAAQITRSDPHLLYSISLCHFKENNASTALKVLAEVIEKAAQEHPELSIGSQGSDNLLSVGNTQALQDSALIEAFNLKCAIELQLKNEDAAKQALLDMPPRETKDLDTCTLHNKALVTITDDPEEGFRTLNFLISNAPFPPEAFANLLFLYIKPPHGLYDFAADTMAQHTEYVQRYLPREQQMFLDAVTMKQSSAHGAFQQLEQLAKQHIEKLRLQMKLFQDARNTSNTQMLTQRMREYEDELERYIPVLMAQAQMFWDQGQYSNVLAVLQQSKEFVSENETWKLNLAHTFFMLDSPAGNFDDAGQSNFQRAIELYHPIYQHHLERKSLLKVSAMVLANLCVAFIMDEKNHEAEEIMKQVELEEERSKRQKPAMQALHSCIINLVIGTLYCAKQNYEFGISRIMKSIQPLDQKLETDTWFYAKRCFLAIADGICKHIILLNDKTVSEILAFLDEAQVVGSDMPATISVIEKSRRSVGTEAQMLRKIIAKYYNS